MIKKQLPAADISVEIPPRYQLLRLERTALLSLLEALFPSDEVCTTPAPCEDLCSDLRRHRGSALIFQVLTEILYHTVRFILIAYVSLYRDWGVFRTLIVSIFCLTIILSLHSLSPFFFQSVRMNQVSTCGVSCLDISSDRMPCLLSTVSTFPIVTGNSVVQ